MSWILVEFLILLTAALYCTAAPADEGCGHPGSMMEAALDGDWTANRYPSGKTATYSCRPGYSRLGTIRKVCIEGQWDFVGTKGQCKKKSCGHPGDIPFGTFELKAEDEFVFGAIVEYSCDEGYRMVSRQKKRECTATGWSNFPPHCEVQRCPPVEVTDKVNVLSTSYDEEYSVGQVVRFECKDPKQKLEGPSEIFCKSEGEWNLNPPICVEITCSPPVINKGKVSKLKLTNYKENELIQFTCDSGYKASRNGETTCTKAGWSPTPSCDEITCDPYQQVKNGKLIKDKDVYREGNTIKFVCDDYYTIEHSPNDPRVCTSNGWSPPLSCINKKCERPEIKNGWLHSYYSFPSHPGATVGYRCNTNFLTPNRREDGSIYCAATGWRPEPKCSRKCNYKEAVLDNANTHLYPTQHAYVEGDKIQFICNGDFKTADGTDRGWMICLPNGKFSPSKCSKTCSIASLQYGKYQPHKSEFDIGEYLRYECNDGFTTPNGKFVGSSQCLTSGWSSDLKCIAIHCNFDDKAYSNGHIFTYRCPGKNSLTSHSSQCFHYGWGPPVTCPDKKPIQPTESPDTESADKKSIQPTESPDTEAPVPAQPDSPKVPVQKPDSRKECPPAHSPTNVKIIDRKLKYYSGETMKMKCDKGYTMHGSASVQCKNGVWDSPPQCIQSKQCKNPLTIKHGELTEDSKQKSYITDNIVRYRCNLGFQISESDQSICVDGQWTAPPICTEKSCGEAPSVENAVIRGTKTDYEHGENANYQCNKDFAFAGGSSAECIEGKWLNIPTCTTTSCGPAPEVPNANIITKKNKFASGEKAMYQCVIGYSLEQLGAVCENTQWEDIPVCRRIGESCGPAPIVQFGDTKDVRKTFYDSGSTVEYKCPNFHVLTGNKTVTCWNGVWENAPVCLEPCTAKETDMKQNNIQLRYGRNQKLYSEHGNTIEFSCLNGYDSPSGTNMRITCDKGVLQYPKCFKKGSCILQSTIMISSNIYYNKSTVVELGETIAFECNEGMFPENGLRATCTQNGIKYPKCIATKSCSDPIIQHGNLKTEQQGNYDSGSSVEFQCNENYVLSGNINVKCDNGQWIDPPQCLRPCQISIEDVNKNNIQLPSSDALRIIYEHGTGVDFTCKPKFKHPNLAYLKSVCYDGNMKYHRCFAGKTCRIDQDKVDENNLELHEVHDNEVYYEEDEIILFKCKGGFQGDNKPTGNCSKQTISYPKCTPRV
ncbi:complement factor H-like isoform X2 [Mixophyes fleayi]|uniref:complement factor H-like isoform X2 n=1 Tax=Mixophyes fleayi TaxID=3061075 RepID=UPI003F4DB4CF